MLALLCKSLAVHTSSSPEAHHCSSCLKRAGNCSFCWPTRGQMQAVMCALWPTAAGCNTHTQRCVYRSQLCHSCGAVQARRHLTAAILASRLRSSTALPRTRITSGWSGCSKAYGICTASCTSPSHQMDVTLTLYRKQRVPLHKEACYLQGRAVLSQGLNCLKKSRLHK